MKKYFYSHGKIMLSGEYAVLDGAWATVLATRKGQTLEVEYTDNKHQLHWKSYDENGQIWFEVIFFSPSLKIGYSTDWQTAKVLKNIFLQREFKERISSKCMMGILIKTRLEFPINWGLGSSASLLANLAKWLEIDPYLLIDKTFGGSGCDISCAFLGKSILYKLQPYKRCIKPIYFNPSFSEELFFLYLNKKQNTRSAISNYNSKKKCIQTIKLLSDISLDIAYCENIENFKELLNEHEHLTCKILNLLPLKERLFKDYPSSIKSLGAWGGDFALIIRTEDMESYFNNKGYYTLISFRDLILSTD